MLGPQFPNRLWPDKEPLDVLDVGCGIHPQELFPSARTVRLDAFQPYLERVDGIRVCAEWQRFFAMLLPHSFDAVVALDFIEHLTRRQGLRFLREAQRVAPYVVIFTPNGKMAQTEDAWNMGGDHWQTHRSAWTLADFDGWRTDLNPHYNGVGAIWAAKP